MRWWQWVIVAAVIYSIVLAWAIAFLRGAHVDDEGEQP